MADTIVVAVAPPAKIAVQQTRSPITVAQVGVQGPQGGDASLHTGIASAPVSALQVLKYASGTEMAVASNTVAADRNLIAGISIMSAAGGAPVTIKSSGIIEDPSFNFTPGLPIFLGAAGALTQAPPTSPSAAFIIRLGSAVSAAVMSVQIDQPVLL